MEFGSFDCIFSAEGKKGNSPEDIKKRFQLELSHRACFGQAYAELTGFPYYEVTYKVYLTKEDLPNKGYNLCTKAETKKILRCLQKTAPFTYKFSEDTYKLSAFREETTQYNVLEVTVRGNRTQHVWVTTMLRCFFEYPYNIAAKEACVLQSEIREVDGFDFTKENWINLYLTIVAKIGGSIGHGFVHLEYDQPTAKTYKEWSDKLKSLNGTVSIWKSISSAGKRFHNREYTFINNMDKYNKGTASRAQVYTAAYKDKLSWKK